MQASIDATEARGIRSPLELESQVVLSCLRWGLGTELRPSARAILFLLGTPSLQRDELYFSSISCKGMMEQDFFIKENCIYFLFGGAGDHTPPPSLQLSSSWMRLYLGTIWYSLATENPQKKASSPLRTYMKGERTWGHLFFGSWDGGVVESSLAA